MKLAMRIRVKETGIFLENLGEEFMHSCGFVKYTKFEDIGIQSDGTPVVFDKCGQFLYLPEEYEMVLMVGGQRL